MANIFIADFKKRIKPSDIKIELERTGVGGNKIKKVKNKKSLSQRIIEETKSW